VTDRDRTSDRKRARSGDHTAPRRKLSASREQWALWAQAVEHAGDAHWADWAREMLDLAACDELGLCPVTREALSIPADPQSARRPGTARSGRRN